MTLPISPGVSQRYPTMLCALLAIGGSAGCTRYLPAAPTPDKVAVDVDAGPAVEGQGRLVVDVVDGPTVVQRMYMDSEPVNDAQIQVMYQFSESSAPLCQASPCILDIPFGNVVLGFPVLGQPGVLEKELVYVGPEPTVYRRTLSWWNGDTGALRVLGIVATSVGVGAGMTGISLLPIGLAQGSDGLTVAGGASLAASAVLLGFGIWAIRRDAPTYRPGSAIHYELGRP